MIRRKSRRREPKLLRGGNVLGVVDDKQFAARLRQRKIERAGLGRWRSRRRDDDFVARRQIERQKAGHRRAIPPLHDQLDVQFGLRIVERVKCGDELPDDGALAIEGRDDRINRQFVVGQHARPLFVRVRDRCDPPQSDRSQKQHPKRCRRDHRQNLKARGAKRDGQRGDKTHECGLRAAKPALGGKRTREATKRIFEHVLGAMRAHEGCEPLRRRDGKALGTQTAGQRHLDQPRGDRRPRRDHGPGAAVRRRERSDAAHQALGRVEILGERRRSAVVGAAEPRGQRLIVGLLADQAGA